MVLTRNQKRGLDDEVDPNLQVSEQYTGINAVKRRRTVQGGNDNSSDGDDESEEGGSFTTETDTTEGESGDEKPKENKLQKVLNLKLSPKQIQHVIRESIKTLTKKFNANEMDFMYTGGDQERVNDEDDDDPYEKFTEYVDAIYSGDFFQRIPIEERTLRLKNTYSTTDMKQLNKELEELQQLYKENAPSVVDILKMNIHTSQKHNLLEKVYQYSNSEMLTGEYNAALKYLMTNINKSQDENMYKLEQEIVQYSKSDAYSDDYRTKILKSDMSFENKVIAYKRFEIMTTYEESDSTEHAKYKNWMDTLLSVPFGKYILTPSVNSMTRDNTKDYLHNIRTVLDKRLSFLEKPKDQIINIVTQMIRNPDFSINAIGLWGARGVGKTSIVKSIAEALNRPYRSISLGGESDASMLTGHGFTYVGSSPGRLIEILRETKCMNPIVLIDELDKVSQTHQGKEIIGTLIHLTDYTTNNKYNYDRYFAGVEFDLSKILFVFTYNDPTKIDKILADRLFKIKVENYAMPEKLEITNKHLINNILDGYGFSQEQIHFADDAINYIVQTSKNDEGMRDIKRKFEIIVSRINTLLLTDESENIIRLKYKSLYPYYRALPVTVQKEHVDLFLTDSICNDNGDSGKPPVGMYT